MKLPEKLRIYFYFIPGKLNANYSFLRNNVSIRQLFFLLKEHVSKEETVSMMQNFGLLFKTYDKEISIEQK